MPVHMTATAWGQGAKNAVICGIAVLVFSCVMAAAVSVISHQPISDSFGAAFAVLWILSLLAFLGTWLYGRMTAGRLLLDCGPQPMRTLFLIVAGLYLIMGSMERGAAPPLSSAFPIPRLMFDVSFAGFCLILATGRLQLRENGIWGYSSLLRWDRIGSYRWANDSTLVVRRRGPLGFFKGALAVPPEHREAVEGLLRQASSGRLAAESTAVPDRPRE